MGVRITIEGEGEFVIRKKRRAELPAKPISKRQSIKKPTLIFLRNIIDQMEIRVESVFRPNQKDVETAYALSGIKVIDMLHKFTSSEVIKKATPLAVYTVTENKIKHILREREDVPEIIVDVHTHPNGIPELSDGDGNTIKKIAEIFKEKLPNTKIYFGIHAISEEKLGRRKNPEVHGNRIKWRSLTREHEVAFFDENCKPVRVEIWQG